MKLRTTVQISSAIAPKKPTLKREDSFLKRFSTRQIPETQVGFHGRIVCSSNWKFTQMSQYYNLSLSLLLFFATKETVEDTGSEGPDPDKIVRRRKRYAKPPRSVVNPDENFYFYWLMVLTICVLYNLWALIVRQSFPELQVSRKPVWWSGQFARLDIRNDVEVMLRFMTVIMKTLACEHHPFA